MKILFAIILFCFVCINANASQHAKNVKYSLLDATSNVSVELFSTFSFGSPSRCPYNKGVDYFQSNDTLHVNTYYDMRGAWPAYFCSHIDTVTFTKPTTGFNYIHVATYEIEYGDTITAIDTEYYGVDTTFILHPTAVKEPGIENYMLYPNPVLNRVFISGYSIKSLSLYDLTGREILSSISYNAKGGLDISALKAGIYYIRIPGALHYRAIRFVKIE